MLMTNQNASANRLRVLQVILPMHRAETARWLAALWRGMDKTRYRFDVLSTDRLAESDQAAIKTYGAQLLIVPSPLRRAAFLSGVRRALREHGPYDIIHVHGFALSGLIQLQAWRAGVPVRITHAHADRRKAQRNRRWRAKLYGWVSRLLIRRLSTAGLADNAAAASALFGDRWWFDARWQIAPQGVDVASFENRQGGSVRQEMGIPLKSKVIGYTGAFRIENNHEFLLDLFARYARSEPAALLLLAGEGPLRAQIERQAGEKNIGARVIFAPPPAQPADLLRAMNLFVSPALYDADGIAVIEAQAAGLPCLISEATPADADIVKGSIMRAALEDGVDPWLEKIRLLLEIPKPHAGIALETVKASEHTIESNVAQLSALYERLYAEQMG